MDRGKHDEMVERHPATEVSNVRIVGITVPQLLFSQDGTGVHPEYECRVIVWIQNLFCAGDLNYLHTARVRVRCSGYVRVCL